MPRADQAEYRGLRECVRVINVPQGFHCCLSLSLPPFCFLLIIGACAFCVLELAIIDL